MSAHNRTFYRELAGGLADKGWLLFSVVEFDGRPIAFHYGFDYEGPVLWYKPSFDVAHASGSPGLVLVRSLIAYAIAHGRREVDFTVGDEPFKARFTNSFQTTVRCCIYRDPVRYALARARWLATQLKKHSTSGALNGPGTGLTPKWTRAGSEARLK